MSRLALFVAAGLAGALAGSGAVSGLSVPNVTVGRNLQAAANVLLPQPLPPGGLELTLTSNDPSRVLLSAAQDRAGSPSIKLVAKPPLPVSPTYWIHGLSDSGTVTYTIQAPGFPSAKGAVTLAPSGIAIVGPFRLPSFPTTPRGAPSKLTVVSAVLNSAGDIVEEQEVAGGLNAVVAIQSSNPAAGSAQDAELTVRGGSSTAITYFQPRAEGSTTLTPRPPAGFHAPLTMAKVTASVEKPGLAITDELTIGKDLQILGVLCLGEMAAGGTEVTLTSSDPSKLVLSADETALGSGKLVLKAPEGELTAKYYIQALADSGSVTYSAEAAGFRRRIAKIELAPSGFIVAYERYGPPDRAMVERKNPKELDERRFYPSMAESKEREIRVAVYSAYIDPQSGMAADITVQPLRAGISSKIELHSSNPEIGTVESPVNIGSGGNRAFSRFTPVAPGDTVIRLKAPAGFTTPKNAAFVPARVVP